MGTVVAKTRQFSWADVHLGKPSRERTSRLRRSWFTFRKLYFRRRNRDGIHLLWNLSCFYKVIANLISLVWPSLLPRSDWDPMSLPWAPYAKQPNSACWHPVSLPLLLPLQVILGTWLMEGPITGAGRSQPSWPRKTPFRCCRKEKGTQPMRSPSLWSPALTQRGRSWQKGTGRRPGRSNSFWWRRSDQFQGPFDLVLPWNQKHHFFLFV